MNRQSRAERWVRILETAEGFVQSTLESLTAFHQRASDIPAEGRIAMLRYASDSIKLAAETDPPIEGTPLAAQLHRVMQCTQGLDPAAGFEPTMRALLAAISDVLPRLRETVVDDVQSAKDIVTELERSFMVSLTISMTAHTTTLAWVNEWEAAHREFLEGRRASDIGHYRTMRATNVDPENPYRWPPARPNFWADKPGSGRIHVQHLIVAIHSGSNMLVAGAGMRTFDYYPEVQTIAYGQWFAYIHAVWEEQFRGQLAEYWSRSLPAGEEPFGVNDVMSDFFGDLRLIRNDFVHNKGLVNESANLRCLEWRLTPGEPIKMEVERMVELMDKFPRVELLEPPRRPTITTSAKVQARRNMPSSGKTELVDAFEKIIASKQLNKRRANDDMLRDWVDKHRTSNGCAVAPEQ